MEVHYKFYEVFFDNKTIRKHFNNEQFQETGRAVILTILEMDQLRGTNTFLSDKAKNIIFDPKSNYLFHS